MKIASFVNSLTLGGTEKAACRWAWGLMERQHQVTAVVLQDGPRRADLEKRGVPLRVVEPSAHAVADALREIRPDVIHAHVPGHPHLGDVLGEALAIVGKIPVVQTNIFGHLHNLKEDAWTDLRLFISWTSCVQAARRANRALDMTFFRRVSVAVYPIDPEVPASPAEVAAFRKRHGVAESEILFGRLSRPDPNKWTDLPLNAFHVALRRNRAIKLLLREPPVEVAEKIRRSAEAERFIILPATADDRELRLTISALDVVLHTSSIGESFGYGIAEPMNLGKPIISHSVPWADQAQIELVRQGECGFVASSPSAMGEAMLRLADSGELRQRFGEAAQSHIRELANAETSIARLAAVLQAAREGRDNPFAEADLQKALATRKHLASQQFGHSLGEQMLLRSGYWRSCFHRWRKAIRFARSSQNP